MHFHLPSHLRGQHTITLLHQQKINAMLTCYINRYTPNHAAILPYVLPCVICIVPHHHLYSATSTFVQFHVNICRHHVSQLYSSKSASVFPCVYLYYHVLSLQRFHVESMSYFSLSGQNFRRPCLSHTTFI